MTITERLADIAARSYEDPRSDAPVICCQVCLDSGWEARECTGIDCGRRRRHQPHDYVTPCACRPLNRNYQEAVARGRRAA